MRPVTKEGRRKTRPEHTQEKGAFRLKRLILQILHTCCSDMCKPTYSCIFAHGLAKHRRQSRKHNLSSQAAQADRRHAAQSCLYQAIQIVNGLDLGEGPTCSLTYRVACSVRAMAGGCAGCCEAQRERRTFEESKHWTHR